MMDSDIPQRWRGRRSLRSLDLLALECHHQSFLVFRLLEWSTSKLTQ
jgi:hypothetical protein